jgi:hypothetical protein
MASIAYQPPSKSASFQVSILVRREAALLVLALALFLGGLGVALALHGSHADRTPSLVPTQTQSAP